MNWISDGNDKLSGVMRIPTSGGIYQISIKSAKDFFAIYEYVKSREEAAKNTVENVLSELKRERADSIAKNLL